MGRPLSLTLHLKDSKSALHQCNFTFITGDVEGPILGIDFLRKFNMTVDPVAACVWCGDGAIFPGILSLSLNNPVLGAPPADIQPIITTFSDVCSTKKSMPPPAVGVQHFLQTEGQIALRQGDLRSLGTGRSCQRSDSQWSSPLHMVKKKDGSWQPCGDFRRLNLATQADKYCTWCSTWGTSQASSKAAQSSAP